MKRREFIALMGGITLLPPISARAQTVGSLSRRPIIGIIALLASENSKGFIATFLQALKKLGYVDGESATIVARYAAGEQKMLGRLASEVVALKPDVILADTASPIKVVKSIAPDIPVVGAIMGFPVEQGLIASFAHPGGNVTGMASNVEDMNGKMLELGMEIIPDTKVIGLLVDPEASVTPLVQRDFEAAAGKQGIRLHAAGAHTPNDLDRAIGELGNAGAGFMCIAPSGMFNLNMRLIAQSALSLHLPTISNHPEKADTGILLGYGVDYTENYERAALFVDKILRGAKPSDLPVEFPTKVEMFINIKTAKRLGVLVPQSLLATADEVIE